MPREQIHINFVTEFPEDDGYRTILTCIDYFSKMVVLVPLQEAEALTVASCFLAKVLSHHKLPAIIISNINPRLQGKF